MTTTIDRPLEWNELWAAMDAAPTTWIPTTEHMYWEMLECVPPAAMDGGRFLVGEANNHNSNGEPVYACFKVIHTNPETYEARYMTLREFNSSRF